MGFSNGNATPTTFASINTKEGKLVVRKADKTKEMFSQLRDVRLTRVVIENDEYDGQPVKKGRLTLTMSEGKERAIVDVNLGTYAAASMFAKLNKANLNADFGITVELQKAGSSYKLADNTMSKPLERDMTQISVYQGGYINLVEGERPPKTEYVKVGGKEYPDSQKRDAFVEALITEISGKLGTSSQPDANDPVQQAGPKPSAEDLMDDDIPF